MAIEKADCCKKLFLCRKKKSDNNHSLNYKNYLVDSYSCPSGLSFPETLLPISPSPENSVVPALVKT